MNDAPLAADPAVTRLASADENEAHDPAVAPRDRRGLYAELHPRLLAAGCFRPAPVPVLLDLSATLIVSAVSFVVAAHVPALFAIPLFVIGSFFFYRVGWTLHDAAHGSVFFERRNDEALTTLCGLIMGEFPSGWRYGHNLHHKAPNVRGIDRDKSERWDPALRFSSPAAAFVHVLLLVRRGRLVLPRNLLLLGLRDGVYAWRYARGRFPRELALVVVSHALQIAGFLVVFGPRMGAFALLLHAVHTTIGALYLNTIFAGNHYDMPTFDAPAHLAVDAAALQIVTASNYEGGAGMMFLCGGLEKQIEHHLFPRMPRHHLHTAAPIVRRFAEEKGLPYVERSLTEAIAAVVRFHVVPRDVAAPAAAPAAVLPQERA